MIRPRAQVLYLVLLILAVLPNEGRASEPSTRAARQLKPGDIVRIGRLAVGVPPPGRGVTLFTDFANGSHQKLRVVTEEDGTVLVNPPKREPPSYRHGRVPTTECSDGYTDVSNEYWSTYMNWYFNAGSNPDELNVDNTETSLKNAVNNIIHEDNNCSRSDYFTYSATYQGRTSRSVDINTNNTCVPDGQSDGYSVAGFGTLPQSVIAATCNFDGNPIIDESDVRFNKYWWDWVNIAGPSCSNKLYVEGIATHERGHTWSAEDFPSGHPDLTMGGANGECPGIDAKKTLGLGDMYSIEYYYS